MVDLIKTLLSSGHKYFLPGKIQSDRVEGEFGLYRQNSKIQSDRVEVEFGIYRQNSKIQSDRVEGEFGLYRQNSGGNYFISSSLNLERIKLFKKLDLQREENTLCDCCTATLDLSEEELHLLDVCFSETSNITSNEKSSLYYGSG